MNTRKQIDGKIIEIRDELIALGVVKNRTEFASKIGSYPSIVSDIADKKRSASFDMVIKLIDVFKEHINVLELLGLDDNNILFLTNATAGPSIAVSEQKSSKFKIPDLHGDFYAFKVSGDSMKPTFYNEDVLVCKKIDEIRYVKNGDVYVVCSDDGINVKRITIVKANNNKEIIGIKLISDNKTYPTTEIDISTQWYEELFLEFYEPIRVITSKGL